MIVYLVNIVPAPWLIAFLLRASLAFSFSVLQTCPRLFIFLRPTHICVCFYIFFLQTDFVVYPGVKVHMRPFKKFKIDLLGPLFYVLIVPWYWSRQAQWDATFNHLSHFVTMDMLKVRSRWVPTQNFDLLHYFDSFSILGSEPFSGISLHLSFRKHSCVSLAECPDWGIFYLWRTPTTVKESEINGLVCPEFLKAFLVRQSQDKWLLVSSVAAAMIALWSD